VFIGPVFSREAATMPRRGRFYLNRTLYVAGLVMLMITAWLVMAGTQNISSVGDMSRFGSILFQILAPVQLALVLFLSAVLSASSVSQEKDRQTLILLLMTSMSNRELVLGKLMASLLNVLVMVSAALPVFMLIILLGGVSLWQVAAVFAVTICSALAAGSLGAVLAFWREKTFQTLSLTALALVLWLGVWEAVQAGLLGSHVAGIPAGTIAAGFSPFRAILAAAQPSFAAAGSLVGNGAPLFIVVSITGAVLMNIISIMMVRVWNPTREVRPGQKEEEESKADESIWSPEHQASQTNAARDTHIDARTAPADRAKTRVVWDNPVLWREVCTWAYGRKVMIIRVVYVLMALVVAAALYSAVSSGAVQRQGDELSTLVPAGAKPLGPLYLVSLVIVNALAVTSITNERDGRALDLLLVTDLSPREFVFGKLGGVMWVTKEMILLPVLLTCYLSFSGGLSLENLFYVVGGLAVMNIFVAMLGVHCGMIYANSRTAIGVSLGTVFFLFLGVVTCIVMMISFSGSFQTQLAPFLAFILGGGIGLYVTLGARNPSTAIAIASLMLPFATFYAITSFLLGYNLPVFLVTVVVYGFTTAAMLMPAIGDFDIATAARSKVADD